MRVLPNITLDAERIENIDTLERVRSVDNLPKVMPPNGWEDFIGGCILKGPHGTFAVTKAEFEANYEVVVPV